MTDFVSRVLRPERNDWIIRSLLDIDFYKFTMGYFIWKLHSGVRVSFRLINRNLRLPLATLIDEAELRAQLDHVRTLKFRRTDIYYLRGMDIYGERMFSEEYLKFLENVQLPPYRLERKGDQYELTFEGPWEKVTFWETIALAIICEMLYRKLMQSMTKAELQALYGAATNKLYGKLRLLKSRPGIRFADFGQRRRHSFLWQQFAIEMAREVMGPNFTGTSNTWMAFNQDLVPIGTNAHELPMVLTALAPDELKKMAQYDVLREWAKLYPQNALRIVLPDTYGSAQFWRDMPKGLAKEVAETWRGEREDSGNPILGSLAFVGWLKSHGIDPVRILQQKIVIPSDGLDADAPEAGSSMIKIDEALDCIIPHPFGWGTNFSNGFEGCHPRGDEMAIIDNVKFDLTWGQLFRGQSLVIKVESANGNGAVKLSNNIKKATGRPEDIARYVGIFGKEGQVSQDVFV
jgi:nicotinate phosphoribosyltransferase